MILIPHEEKDAAGPWKKDYRLKEFLSLEGQGLL